MNEFLAAPESFLPLSLTALVSHAPLISAWHFLIEEALAAPASGLPPLLSALASHVSEPCLGRGNGGKEREYERSNGLHEGDSSGKMISDVTSVEMARPIVPRIMVERRAICRLWRTEHCPTDIVFSIGQKSDSGTPSNLRTAGRDPIYT